MQQPHEVVFDEDVDQDILVFPSFAEAWRYACQRPSDYIKEVRPLKHL